MADRPLFRMNEHGDVWQELELIDQPDLAAAGDENVTSAEFVFEHRAAMRRRHRERMEERDDPDDDPPPFWDAYV